MADDAMIPVRTLIAERLQDIQRRADRLTPCDLHARMEAIRSIAGAHGMAALERLAHRSAQLALLPGHRVTTRRCMEHMETALASRSAADSTTILAALAVSLH